MIYLEELTIKLINFYEKYKDKSGEEMFKRVFPHKDKMKFRIYGDNFKYISPFYIYSSFWKEDSEEISVWKEILGDFKTKPSPKYLKSRNRTDLVSSKLKDQANKEWRFIYICSKKPIKAITLMKKLEKYQGYQEMSLIAFSVSPTKFFPFEKNAEALLHYNEIIKTGSSLITLFKKISSSKKEYSNFFYKLLNDSFTKEDFSRFLKIMNKKSTTAQTHREMRSFLKRYKFKIDNFSELGTEGYLKYKDKKVNIVYSIDEIDNEIICSLSSEKKVNSFIEKFSENFEIRTEEMYKFKKKYSYIIYMY